MNIDSINRWLTLAANLGVIAGIVFLGIELNQNTATQRVSAAQQVLDISASINLDIFTAGIDSEYDRPSFFERNPNDLSEEELGQFRLLASAVFANHWQVYYQYRAGVMDEEIFEAYERRTENLISIPLYLLWWEESKFMYSDSFQAWVDNLIDRKK